MANRAQGIAALSLRCGFRSGSQQDIVVGWGGIKEQGTNLVGRVAGKHRCLTFTGHVIWHQACCLDMETSGNKRLRFLQVTGGLPGGGKPTFSPTSVVVRSTVVGVRTIASSFTNQEGYVALASMCGQCP